jgi:hypothetical protein
MLLAHMELIETKKNKVMWAFRIDETTKLMLEACAKHSNRKMADFIRELVRFYYESNKQHIGPIAGIDDTPSLLVRRGITPTKKGGK